MTKWKTCDDLEFVTEVDALRHENKLLQLRVFELEEAISDYRKAKEPRLKPGHNV